MLCDGESAQKLFLEACRGAPVGGRVLSWGKGIDRDVSCACACLKSICLGTLHPGAARAVQDWQEALESTKSQTREVIRRNLRAVVME